MIYGIDAVHGHNTVYGATIFPHNVGLGATRNATLVEQVSRPVHGARNLSSDLFELARAFLDLGLNQETNVLTTKAGNDYEVPCRV
jgi:hypothetical protein